METTDHRTEARLEVGLAVQIHPLPTRVGNPRHRALIRGWHRGDHILLEIPHYDAGCRIALLKEGDLLALRYLHNGIACGFSTSVESFDTTHRPWLLRVAWPKRVEEVHVRRQERIGVSIPCTFVMENEEVAKGSVTDLSVGGCAIQCDFPAAAHENQNVTLSFTLPDGFQVRRLPATVKAARTDAEVSSLGCAFNSLDLLTRDALHFFVTATLERTRTSTRPNRVLILEQRRDVIRYLCQELHNRGYEVSIALGVVDACYRLRIMPPRAVLVSTELDEMPAPQLCRLLRGSPELEDLAIVAYGSHNEVLEHALFDAGVSACLPSAYAIEEVAAALVVP